jgi:predicted enzyme related to lactoylglutathione lyase
MLTVGTVVVGVDDLARAKAFWSAALGYVPREPGDETWVVLVPPTGVGSGVALAKSETHVQQHPRIHLDLYADDQAAEVQRLLELGATRVPWDFYDEHSDFIVLADTEGNRFCVIDKSTPSTEA